MAKKDGLWRRLRSWQARRTKAALGAAWRASLRRMNEEEYTRGRLRGTIPRDVSFLAYGYAHVPPAAAPPQRGFWRGLTHLLGLAPSWTYRDFWFGVEAKRLADFLRSQAPEWKPADPALATTLSLSANFNKANAERRDYLAAAAVLDSLHDLK